MDRTSSKRILITLIILICYQLIKYIPLFGIDHQEFFSATKYPIYSRITVFSLGLMPYISAYILVMLITAAVPYVKRISQKEGLSSPKLNKSVIYLTLTLALLQSYFIARWFVNLTSSYNEPVIQLPDYLFILLTMLSLTLGVFLIIWLGKIITKYGIGNGISLIILVSIGDEIFKHLYEIYNSCILQNNIRSFVLFAGAVIVLAYAIVYVLRYKKQISVRANNNKAKKAYLDVPVSLPGILPLVFAASLTLIPTTVVALIGASSNSLLSRTTHFLGRDNVMISWIIFAVITVLFAYFVSLIIFKPKTIQRKIESAGLIIADKTNKPTAHYLCDTAIKYFILWAIFMAALSFTWRSLAYWLNLPYASVNARELILFVGISFAVWQTFKYKQYSNKVYQSNDVGEILPVKALLESEGIKTYLHNEESIARLLPLNVGELAVKKLLVEEKNLSRAKEVVSKIKNE